MNSYRATEMQVIQWAQDRQIIPNSTPMAQAIKTKEEVGELFDALMTKDHAALRDAYGDILVTLIIGAALADVDLVDCLNDAYKEIKDRKGHLNAAGIFVKETALDQMTANAKELGLGYVAGETK
jgi:NTP pyrophosphatase (non-canonical NTP hydrolase)